MLRRSPSIFWLVLATGVFWLFRDGLQGNVVAFRDGLHFYYPLHEWIARQVVLEKLIPEFNPQDGLGTSLVGEGTSAVFYPLCWILLLPGVSTATRLTLFTVLHCLIAATGAAHATRSMGGSRSSSRLAAASYGLACPVIFQHVNLPYLISAAWAPWFASQAILLASTQALGSNDFDSHREQSINQPLNGRRMCIARTLLLALISTLMILGGDIHAVANGFILYAVALIARSFFDRSWQELPLKATLLVGCFSCCVLLSAVQLLPTWYWVSQSTRWDAAGSETHRDIELGAYAALPQGHPMRAPDELHLLLTDSTTTSSNRHRIYDYSIAPWSLASMLWPGVGGHFLQTHSRWPSVLSAEPRMWIPSCSIGVVPAILLLVTLRSPRRTPRRTNSNLLLILAAFSCLAMLGNYGPVWLLRCISGWFGNQELDNQLPNDEYGSLYWLLTQTIPTYASFRFPAKWSVWFATCLSIAAGLALDRLDKTSWSRSRRITLIILLIASCTVFLWSMLADSVSQHIPLAGQWKQWIEAKEPDPWLGQCNANASLKQIAFSTALTSAVLAISLWLGPTIANRPNWKLAVPWIVLVEMLLAASGWIVFVTPDAMSVPIPSQHLSREVDSRPSVADSPLALDVRAVRVWANSSAANVDADNSPLDTPNLSTEASDRVRRLAHYQSTFRLGKLHLLLNESNLGAITTATPRSVTLVRDRLMQIDNLASANDRLDSLLGWLGVERRLARLATPLPMRNSERPNNTLASSTTPHLVWQSIRAPHPFVSLICSASPISPDPTAISGAESTSETLDQGRCRWKWKSWGSRKIQISIEAEQPCHLVLRQYQDGGWSATAVDSQVHADTTLSEEIPIQVRRFAGIFQSVAVPQGKHIVTLRYQTPGLRIGIAISCISSVLLLTIAAMNMPGSGRFLQRFRWNQAKL